MDVANMLRLFARCCFVEGAKNERLFDVLLDGLCREAVWVALDVDLKHCL